MQNADGGWGAFDHENNLQFLNHIPFADHNAMLDPSTADVTARAVECLGQMGWPAEHPILQRATSFIRHEQTDEGAWFGRWGVNYVYGTSGVLRALETIGQSTGAEGQKAAIRRIDSFVLRRDAEGERQEHGVADCVGPDWIAGGGGSE